MNCIALISLGISRSAHSNKQMCRFYHKNVIAGDIEYCGSDGGYHYRPHDVLTLKPFGQNYRHKCWP